MHGWVLWHAAVTFAGGATAQHALVRIVKSMPPLPEGAGWWVRWGYAALQAVTAVDK